MQENNAESKKPRSDVDRWVMGVLPLVLILGLFLTLHGVLVIGAALVSKA